MEPEPIRLIELEPGDIGFGPIDGLLGTLVGFGQVMLGDDSRFRHVFVVTEGHVPGGEGIYPPRAVEAMPSGARVVDVSDRWDERFVYVRLEAWPAEIRRQVARHAEAMEGTPYGFSDYLALALKHWGVRLPRLDQWISRTNLEGYPKRAICSQLADHALTRAGIKIFRDGRLSQDVIPGALLFQLLRMGGRAFWPS